MLKQWWNGEFIGGNYRRHWSANFMRAVVSFLQKEWKWSIGTAIAVVGIGLTVL